MPLLNHKSGTNTMRDTPHPSLHTGSVVVIMGRPRRRHIVEENPKYTYNLFCYSLSYILTKLFCCVAKKGGFYSVVFIYLPSFITHIPTSIALPHHTLPHKCLNCHHFEPPIFSSLLPFSQSGTYILWKTTVKPP